MSADFNVPEIPVSKDLIERVQFSVSSRNAEAKVSECGTHVFASAYVDNPNNIEWQYITSGVTCILRNKELAKNGKKQVWAMNLCLYNANYGVLVWKGKLSPYSDYTAVADNVHVFSLSETNGIVGLVFTDSSQAKELHKTYLSWHEERMRDERSKGGSGSPAPQHRFKKEMISKPCNFQHIQGTQALDECLAIDKIKSDIAMAFLALGTGRARMESIDGLAQARRGSSSGKRKREISKPRLEFGKLALPRASSIGGNPPEVTYDQSPSEGASSPMSEGLPYTTTMGGGVPSPGAENFSPNPNLPNPALGQVANGYPVEDYPPPAVPTNGYSGYNTAGLQAPAAHYDLDAEVQQLTTLQGTLYTGASQTGATEWRPPGRLSPLNMEEEFLQSELFTSSVMPTY